MTASTAAPCAPWCDESDLFPPCSELYDLGEFTKAAEIASGLLWRLSGRQYPGVCTTTVRPCAKPRAMRQSGEWPAGLTFGTSSWPSWALALPAGWIGGWGSCDCNRAERCGCGSLSQVELPGPVVEVTKVLVDGVELTADVDYRVDDNRWLVRLNGERWPCCQNLGLPSTEPGTFEVTENYGLAPPPEGVFAAAELTCELLHAMTPGKEKDCRLPRKTVSVVKQGVSMAILDISQFLASGRTGLYWCDLFIGATNPKGFQEPASVHSPDLPSAPRRVGT